METDLHPLDDADDAQRDEHGDESASGGEGTHDVIVQRLGVVVGWDSDGRVYLGVRRARICGKQC